MKFKVGDKVSKPKGYSFDGIVVAVFENTKKEVRVVAELEGNGMLHIFTEGQLEVREVPCEYCEAMTIVMKPGKCPICQGTQTEKEKKKYSDMVDGILGRPASTMSEKNGWVSVKEEMPEIGEYDDETINVMVTDGGRVGYGHYNYDSSYWVYHFPTFYEQTGNEITHWMPLPKQPKVK